MSLAKNQRSTAGFDAETQTRQSKTARNLRVDVHTHVGVSQGKRYTPVGDGPQDRDSSKQREKDEILETAACSGAVAMPACIGSPGLHVHHATPAGILLTSQVLDPDLDRLNRQSLPCRDYSSSSIFCLVLLRPFAFRLHLALTATFQLAADTMFRSASIGDCPSNHSLHMR